MSARNRFWQWVRNLFSRREQATIDYDARDAFEDKMRTIAARVERVGIVTAVQTDRHRDGGNGGHEYR